MVRLYGEQKSVSRRPVLIGVGLLALALLAAVIFVIANARATRLANARAWTVSGPPCARTTTAALAALGYDVRQVVSLPGARFTRAHGEATCTTIGYDGGRSDSEFPVCEFNHPGGVVVTTAKGTFAFQPGGVSGATVQVPNGQPNCVVATNREIE